MTFNNSGNRVRVTGFISSDITSQSAYSIEFKLAVPRKAKRGEESFNDVFTVYANESSTITFAKNHLKKGSVVIVKGELRTFNKGTIKICSSDITITSVSK